MKFKKTLISIKNKYTCTHTNSYSALYDVIFFLSTANRINISQSTYTALHKIGGFVVRKRGTVLVKVRSLVASNQT